MDLFKSKPKEPLVMVVDDDVMLMEMYEAFMEGLNCRVIKVMDNRTTVAMVERMRPDLLIMDISMPNITGLQILNILKAKPTTKNIPVIMITGEQSTGDVETAFQLGAVDYVVKPVNRMTFEQKVRPLIKAKL
ncbi:MAG: hypothetical protein A2234_07460 [Elusimicrobia bacterium RIFOXYA2_FULL_58_8]|nr:MAG: hypothetical protein A2234_07460 [Elusimicrobia bacterium RIFOXYA2_FULL_58_8]OGS13706.1 MAG: hypothetical protein A2285_01225 [Elusimicrobia bacterium RIFOXYA12_FULL_57_11]